jgi:hypothetical protein
MNMIHGLLISIALMPAPEFDLLKERVSDAAFPEEQLSIIERIPKSSGLSCSQTVRLLEELSFSRDQMTVIQRLIPQIHDLENRHVILDFLTYNDDWKKAAQLLDTAYAQRKDALHAQEQAEAEISHQEEVAQLRAWAQRLEAKEALLERRERALLLREEQLQFSQKVPTVHVVPAPAQDLAWVGHCPMGIKPNGVAKGNCIPFHEANFHPKTQHGQRLMVKVVKPGTVKLRMELGPKMRKCQVVGNSTTITKQIVKTTRPNQIIDVTSLIDKWNVDYIRVTASSKGQKTSTIIDDWQHCGS